MPVGVLDGQRPAVRNAIVNAVYSWIAANRLHLRKGRHQYQCPVQGQPDITLTVEFTPYGSSVPAEGSLLVRRQQIVNDLDKVMEKALTNKLPKLVKTDANKRILFLERDQFTFFPEQILDEIERQRPNFPLLNQVDEIWILETVGYRSGGHLSFDLYDKQKERLADLIFRNRVLTSHSKGNMQYPI